VASAGSTAAKKREVKSCTGLENRACSIFRAYYFNAAAGRSETDEIVIPERFYD
jgi:hypothetical protein